MYNNLTVEELEEKAFHNLSVDNILKHCDPFGSWVELEKPISKEEIDDCLKKENESLENTPLVVVKSEVEDLAIFRLNHIKKIAYFVKNGFDDPITIDVGIPEFGILPVHLIEDGNHRFAAAVLRKDETIKVQLNGSEDHAKRLDLWNPNSFQKILDEMS